jgi:hypothetical protein
MKCTNCGNDTNQIRTSHRRNIRGKLVNLMPVGAEWCNECVKAAQLPTLHAIHVERELELSKY